MIRPCFNKLSSAVRMVFDGMAKPIPCEPPVREMMAVLMPITSPRKLINGPPLFPGLIAASVCSRSPKASVRLGRPLELMIPSVTVSSNPNGLPMAKTKSPAWTVSLFAADADLLRCFHRHDRWNHAAYERAPFLVQRFQGCDLLWIGVRR